MAEKDITPKLNTPSSAEVPYGVDTTNQDILSVPAGTMVSPTKSTSVGGLQVGATEVSQGSGNDIFKISPLGIWLGAANFADAPFSVDMQGNVIADTLVTTELHIPDATTANSFHVDTLGNTWWGAVLIAGATAKILNTGSATFSDVTITGGSVAVSTLNGTLSFANLDVAVQGWTQTCAFTVTDADTIAWGNGTFTTAGGTTYNITGANTGNMAAKTYIYLDTGVSTTVYQTTTTASTAVGAGKVLIAIAQNGTGEATYNVLSGQGGQNIDGANIVVKTITAAEVADATITAAKIAALTITANEIAANTITAAKIAANTITASEIAAHTIAAGQIVANTITANELSTSITYAGTIIVDTNGNIRSGQTAFDTGTGWFIGSPSGTAKFSFGNSAGNKITWDGATLLIVGTVPDTQVFTASGTWTKPAGALFVRVVLVGAGGGGAGGHSQFGYAGTGGGGGAIFERIFRASDLSATVAITVGTGGAGGSATNNGSPGGTSSFGTYIYAYGGGGGLQGNTSSKTGGGGGGSGGVGALGAAGADCLGGVPASVAGAFGISGQGGGGKQASYGRSAEYGGGAGGGDAPSKGGSSLFGAGGGGGGGSGNVAGEEGGGIGSYVAGGGGAGGANGNPATAGTAGTDGNTTKCGTGGGGGGGSSGGGTAAVGGAGGAVGGGGGGGGGAAGGTSAAGGAGGRGQVVIYTS